MPSHDAVERDPSEPAAEKRDSVEKQGRRSLGEEDKRWGTGGGSRSLIIVLISHDSILYCASLPFRHQAPAWFFRSQPCMRISGRYETTTYRRPT